MKKLLASIILLAACAASALNWTNYPFMTVPNTNDTFMLGTSTTNKQLKASDLLDWTRTNATAIHALGTTNNLASTPFSLTTTLTNVLGTKQITLTNAGTYLVLANAHVAANTTAFAGAKTVTLTLQRTNNTPAALGSTRVITVSSNDFTTGLIGLGTVAVVPVPPLVYVTANTNDVLSVYGNLDSTPASGAIQIVDADITAVRLK